jgi:predicted O-methyltransferase YrrM
MKDISQLSKKIKSVTLILTHRFVLFPSYLRFNLKGHQDAWKIFTHMTTLERLLLYKLGLKLRGNAILVEVGSYLGASACFLASAVEDRGARAKVHCVDTWQNQGMSEGERDTWEEFLKNTIRYRKVIIPQRGFSTDIAENFTEEIDLLFLDGDHSYEQCRRDVIAWLPHLKPGGYIIFHDYGWAEGVKSVVRELIFPIQSTNGHIMQNIYWTRV